MLEISEKIGQPELAANNATANIAFFAIDHFHDAVIHQWLSHVNVEFSLGFMQPQID